MNDSTRTATIAEQQDGKRFDQALAELFPDYSRSRLQGFIKSGHALLDGAVVAPRLRVLTGQAVELRVETVVAIEAQPQAIPLDIVYEDVSHHR